MKAVSLTFIFEVDQDLLSSFTVIKKQPHFLFITDSLIVCYFVRIVVLKVGFMWLIVLFCLNLQLLLTRPTETTGLATTRRQKRVVWPCCR